MISEPNPSPAAVAKRLHFAAGRVDITPPAPVSLAGVEGRTQAWHSVTTALEANALLLADGVVRTLMISADLLYFGPDLVQAIHGCAKRFNIAETHVILAASHTHFAPATDGSKPRLGAVDPGYQAFAKEKLLSLIEALVTSAMAVVTVELVRVVSSLSVNRRLRWRWPTLTSEGFKLGPNVVMAPAPNESRDEYADVLRFVDMRGVVVCVAWKFACHPVCFPDSLKVCSEYPGHARARLRQQLKLDIPVLFLQGFTGDVRPRLLGVRTLKDRLHALRRGPGFGEVGMAQWTQWADQVAEVLCEGVRRPAALVVTAGLDVTCIDVPMSRIIDPVLNPQACEWPLRIQRLVLGNRLELLFLGAEVCSPYLTMLGAGEHTLCVGYTAHVFGYLPSQRQADEGGYEGRSYFARFGLAGALQSGFERAVVDAVLQLRHRKYRSPNSTQAPTEEPAC